MAPRGWSGSPTRRLGFDQIEDFGPDEAVRTYFPGRDDVRFGGAQRLLVAAVSSGTSPAPDPEAHDESVGRAPQHGGPDARTLIPRQRRPPPRPGSVPPAGRRVLPTH
jgi:hypothetical protein